MCLRYLMGMEGYESMTPITCSAEKHVSDLSLTPEVGIGKPWKREHYVRSINHFSMQLIPCQANPYPNNPNSLCTPVTKQTQCPFLFHDLSSYICLFYLSHSPWRCGPVGVRSACSMTLRPRMFRQRVPLVPVKRGCWLCKTGKSGTLKQQFLFHHIILSLLFLLHRPNAFQTNLCKAPCEAPCTCCSSCICPCCSACYWRKSVLEQYGRGMEDYECCQGYLNCPCCPLSMFKVWRGKERTPTVARASWIACCACLTCCLSLKKIGNHVRLVS